MYKHKGFTIVEILISLTIGVFLFAGISLVFVGMRTTSAETSSYGNLQETGRLAISVLSDDLMRQGFWGDLPTALNRSNLSGVIPVAPGSECTGEGINNGTFPGAVGTFRAIWGKTADSANEMGCINDAKIGSDILQIKRVVSNPVVGALPANRYFLVANLTQGQIITSAGPIPVIDSSRTWEYQHHVYFVSEDSAGTEVIPVLNLRSLANTMASQPLIDGVEMFRVMYGVDTNQDGAVNAFISADNMTQALWDSEINAVTGTNSRIIAAKIYVLVRDMLPDQNYTNSTAYQLGDINFIAPNDNYRRMLFSSTVSLYNGDVEIWN
jgi:type IV pilus assembly protein PilW